MHHLPDDRQLRASRLQNHQSALPFASCPATHLRHHHEGVLVCTEVRIVQHGVGIENAHDTHLVKIQPFGNHLRADEQIGAAGREVVDDALVGIPCAGGVEIHAGHTRFGKEVAYPVFYLFGAVSPAMELGRTAVGTLRGHRVGITAIVAGEQVEIFVQRERHVTILTLRHPTTHTALYHRREATAVLEKDGLPTAFKGRAHSR